MELDNLDPKVLDLRARFNNAQVAVDRSYQIAKESFYPESKKVKNPDYKDDGKTHEWDWIDPTPEEKVTSYIKTARLLKLAIEADLNATLKVLEEAPNAKASGASA